MYGPYGTVALADATASGPFRFSGQWGGYQDVETGLILMGFRYYDPASGRFLTRDPIGFLGGINQYSCVTNNPVNLIDPIGLFGLQFGENGPLLGFGDPTFIFTGQNVGEGLGVGFSAVGSSFSFGLWGGGQAACDASFSTSRGLASFGRNTLLSIAPINRVVNWAFTTAPGQAVFWSGEGMGATASAFAEANGAKTLTMTAGGRTLQLADELASTVRIPWAARRPAWAAASRLFAQNSTGEVNAFLNNPGAESVWRTVEEPLLRSLGRTIITHGLP